MRKHDPEGAAARYLGGAMRTRGRRAFEAHLMDCEDCWEEVQVARLGRALAESGRELAPHPLRERVRGVVMLAASTGAWPGHLGDLT